MPQWKKDDRKDEDFRVRYLKKKQIVMHSNLIGRQISTGRCLRDNRLKKKRLLCMEKEIRHNNAVPCVDFL